MRGKDISERALKIIENDLEKYIKDNQKTMEIVKKSDATFDGMPVPTLYTPFYVTEEDLKDFNYIIQTMLSIIDKVTNKYIEDEDYRKLFNYPKFVEELILIDNKYNINVPIGRFDFFYRDVNNFKFIELNTDGASCMNEDNTIGKIMLNTELTRELEDRYDISYFELFESWVKESIKIYKKFDSKNKKPNVAIMDFKESATMTDFNKFKKAYEKHGYNCKIVDPRDVKFKDGKMYYEDYRIDLVYRRIVTFELIDKIDEIPDFIEAYKNQAFCSIGSIRSQIGHNKIFFKVLYDQETWEILSDNEIKFIKKHVPETGIFGGNINIYNHVRKNKDKFIMKPMDMNASQGVFVGRDLNEKNWEDKLKEVWDKDYIFQEFIEPYGRRFAKFEGNSLKKQEFGVVVGVFIYNGNIAGVYNRIGNNNIISNITDYYSIPGILVENKEL